MADEMNEIPLIKRELVCLQDFKKEYKEKFENRKPAELTIAFIDKTNLEMQKQTYNLESLTKTLDTHVKDQKEMDAERKRKDEKLESDMKDYHKEIFSKFDDNKTTLELFFDSLNKKNEEIIKENDKKYAPREVYKIILWVGGIVGTVLVVAAVRLIYQVIVFFVDK
jgi:hypothetical protein